jgi:hypothetical protein
LVLSGYAAAGRDADDGHFNSNVKISLRRGILPHQKHKDFYDSNSTDRGCYGGTQFTMRDFIRFFLIKPFMSLFVFAGLVLSPPVVAAANEDGPDVWEEPMRLLHQGDCAQAWRELWKEARKGNTVALAGLWGSIGFRSLVPPSYFPVSKVSEYTINHYIALAMYLRKNKTIAEDMLRKHGMIPDDLTVEYLEPDVRDKIQSVNKCLKRKRSLDVCYTMAVKLKLIPSFEQYVTFMDNAPRPAFCLPDGRPGPTSAEDLGLRPRAPGSKSVPLRQVDKSDGT